MESKDLKNSYVQYEKEELEKINKIPNRWKRFWAKVWHLIILPFKWIKVNIKDPRTILLLLGVAAVMSLPIWGFYLVGLITGNPWWTGAATTVWLFWAAPLTPFWILTISITAAIKEIINRSEAKKDEQRRTKE